MNTMIFLVGLLVLVVGIALLAVKIAGNAMEVRRKREMERNYGIQNNAKPAKVKVKLPVLLAAGGLVLIVLSQSFAIVPTGYTGVRTTFGLIDQESCMPGFNGLVPFVQEISLVNNKQQDLRFTERVWSETTEQTVVYMENVVVTYSIIPGASAWIYANVDNWIEEVLDQDIVSSSLKAASRSLEASVVTDRSVIEPIARDSLQAAVDEKYGADKVSIKNIIINNMDFEDSYNEAIARKSAASQEQQEQSIRNKTAIEKAEAEAEAKRIAAQGEADAELIKAEAKAKANETVSNSITANTQRQDAIEKWDGQMPQVVGNSDVTFGILQATGLGGTSDGQ